VWGELAAAIEERFKRSAFVPDHCRVSIAGRTGPGGTAMAQKVVVLGGGVAGLSVAHELIERGFDVEVYEALPIPGGKARSIPVPGSGTLGPNGMRKDLPGEHGFRFFPRFYNHVTDTMKRIPYGRGRTVFDNLVDTTRLQLTRFDRAPIEVIGRSPRTLGDVRALLNDIGLLYRGDLELSHDDLAFFGSRVWQIVTSCHERRANEYEKIDWWDFIDAEARSSAYQNILGHGITRSLVAAKARLASTKTIGNIFVQLLFDIAEPGPSCDRVLNGPTNDVWIAPWVDYLTTRGVRYYLDAPVAAINCVQGRIQDVTVRRNGMPQRVAGDYYVCALPVEDVVPLLTPGLLAADPSLANLRQLDQATAWMNGIQIYLTEDIDLAHGHTIYLDSPWALTSISQGQFWEDVDLSQYGNGGVKGIISIDISEWEEKGLNGKTAKDCDPQELTQEVWEQLKRSLNTDGTEVLKDEYLYKWFLDPDVQLRDEAADTNEEPLLVNLVDTWKLRPEAVTRIPNLFLAADYVRTHTDLATMEAANEAARRAVNGILQASGVRATPCNLWKLHEPEIFAPWRALDLVRYQQGLPWDDTLVTLGLAALNLGQETVYAMERATEARSDMLGSGGASSEAINQLFHPLTGGSSRGSSSELGKTMMALIQTAMQLAAVRSAETEAATRGLTAATGAPAVAGIARRAIAAAARGKVRILSR
jgi:uncharacterized protein with NAD-binding domain and iron-sulfur cluster